MLALQERFAVRESEKEAYFSSLIFSPLDFRLIPPSLPFISLSVNHENDHPYLVGSGNEETVYLRSKQ